TVIFADDDPRMSQDFMPYPTNAETGKSMINYRVAPAGENFRNVTGATQVTAVAGDPLVVHAVNAPGSEQPHMFSLGGLSWRADNRITRGEVVAASALGP